MISLSPFTNAFHRYALQAACPFALQQQGKHFFIVVILHWYDFYHNKRKA